MAKKHRGKKKATTKSEQESAPAEIEAHNSVPPASTAPLPTTEGISSNPPTTFSSPLPTRVPRGLQSSPSYIAQQSLKRKRDAEGAKQVLSSSSNPVNNLNEIYQNVDPTVKSEAASESAEKKKGAKGNDSSSDEEAEGAKLEDEKPENGTATVEGVVTGAQEAAQEDEKDYEEEATDAESVSSSGSSSTSADSSFSDDSERDESHQTASENAASDSETEAEPKEPETPSKRIKRKHPTVFGDDALDIQPMTSIATRNPPPPELAAHFKSSPETTVATRNPPPPELEGQFKFSNSITGSNIYRYPKAVLDTLAELESIIPNTVVNHIQGTPSENSKTFFKKHDGGNEDTKRMLVVLQGAKHVIGHLGKMRIGTDGKVADEEMKEELMKKELMRIARERGQEVEDLRGQVKALREEVVELEETGKRKRKSSS